MKRLLVWVLCLGLAACSSPADEPSDADDPTTEPTAVSEPAYWPLTGLPRPDTASTHPIMVVKMDNTSGASPQLGLSEADLVVEELVEGGLTRLAVFYDSELPEVAGPVRSMRASDIAIVSPVDAHLVTSGAASVTISRIRSAGLEFHPEGSPGMSRASDRPAPYNVMVDLPALAATLDAPEEPAAPYLPWAEGDATLPAGKPASSFAADFGSRQTEWTWTGEAYANTNSYAAPGDTFTPDSVLVLKVPIGDAGYLDPAGNPVPETLLTGQGKAFLFHDGRVVALTWHKDSATDALTFTSALGDQLIPAGRVWLELIPAATGTVTWQRGANG